MKSKIIVVATMIVGLVVGYFVPHYNSEYSKFVKVAKMQAVKIAVIEQEARLNEYVTKLREAQEPAQVIVIPKDPE
jgi:hypothetical protein